MRGTFVSLATLACFAAACSLTTDLPTPRNDEPSSSKEDAHEVRDCDPDDARECTTDVCVNGEPVNDPLAAGTACHQDGGSRCDGHGRCVECLDDPGCTDQPGCAGSACLCVAGDCKLASCTNGNLDGHETDFDCGGPFCDPCDDGDTCDIASDCASAVCKAGSCAVPSCYDFVANGDESDIDCGGHCGDCAPGKACHDGSDCDSGVCAHASFTCDAPNCDDGVKNGVETAVDCGGSACGGCELGFACLTDADCVDPYHCTSGACTPALPIVPH